MFVQIRGKQSVTPDQASATQWYPNHRHKEVNRRFYIRMLVAAPF